MITHVKIFIQNIRNKWTQKEEKDERLRISRIGRKSRPT